MKGLGAYARLLLAGLLLNLVLQVRSASTKVQPTQVAAMLETANESIPGSSWQLFMELRSELAIVSPGFFARNATVQIFNETWMLRGVGAADAGLDFSRFPLHQVAFNVAAGRAAQPLQGLACGHALEH